MAPLAWVRRIASEFPEFNTIPLFGNSPPFNWDHFSSLILSRFGLPKVTIRPRDQQWREGSNLKKGLGSHIHVLPISIAPLGTAYWVMSQEDVVKLVTWMMKPTSKNRTSLSEILQEGFYRYLAVEALDAIQGMDPLRELTLQLTEEEYSSDKAFCVDVEIDLDQKSCWGRLVLPAELRSAWIQHFSQLPSEYFPAEIARQTELYVGVKTGSVILHQDEWKKIKKGDFVLLDQGSYDAHKGTGICLLMLNTTPVFNAKIKNNKVELVDYAFYYEDNMVQKGEVPPDNIQKLPAQEGEVVALKELPLYVTVEIARIKMTLDQLMSLTPGNTLEIPVHPDQGVSLTINGQKVGRAELVYLGEQLGLRILEI
jgi:flagellar motor switch protein FliN/FliY